MTDEEYIKKGVELAEGWHDKNDAHSSRIFVESCEGYRGVLPGSKELLDALAAQLVRQVDSHPDAEIETYFMQTIVRVKSAPTIVEGPDRTMNTIKAIVDSEVLDND